jgi:hypothetical protein
LREDLQDGIVTEEDYSMMKKDYDNEKDKLQRELDALMETKIQREETLSVENKWVAEFKRFETEQELTAPMLSALIDRVLVYDNARVEIIPRFRDEFEALKMYLNDFTQLGRAANE